VQTVFVDHAAEILGVSRRTVYYWIRDGKLRTMRTANRSQRVLLVSIETLLQEEVAERTLRTARLLAERMQRRPGATIVGTSL
jgi:excisionase family DNA binding protein